MHLGHREVIRGADTVLTFEPHPRTVVAPDSAPKLLTSLETKADLIAGLGVQELVVIPFDGSFAAQTAQEFIDHELVEPARRRARVGRRELPLRQPRARRRGAAAAAGRVRDARGRGWSSSTARSSPRPTSAGWWRPATWRPRRASSARPFHMRGDDRPRRQARAHARLPDRQPGARRRGWSCPTTASTPAAPRSTARSHVAAVNVGVRPTFKTGRGLLVEAFLLDFDGDIYGRELRLDFLERLRGEQPLRQRRGARRADGRRRRADAPRSPPRRMYERTPPVCGYSAHQQCELS